MTAPAHPELREALAEFIQEHRGYRYPHLADLDTDDLLEGPVADVLTIGKDIATENATLTARIAAVEAERDEARADADRRKAEREITDIRIRNQRAVIRSYMDALDRFRVSEAFVGIMRVCRRRRQEAREARTERDTATARAEAHVAEIRRLRDENTQLRAQLANGSEARARRALGDPRIGVNLATGAALKPQEAGDG